LVPIFPIPSRYISIFRAPPPRYFSPSLTLATVVLSLGELIVFPTFSVEVDQLTPDDLRGSYFGAANLYSLGTALAPLYGGIMLDHAGSQALYLGLAALCGVIMLLQVGAVGLRQAERAGG
ncbi:hypothetical protein ACLBU3_32430, partial [Pseudomonas aeruginosa]